MPDNPNHWYEGTQINEEGKRVPVEAEDESPKKKRASKKSDDDD